MRRKKLLLVILLLTISQVPHIERDVEPLAHQDTMETLTLVYNTPQSILLQQEQKDTVHQYERPSRGDKLIENAEQQSSPSMTELEEVVEEVPEEMEEVPNNNTNELVDTWVSLGVFKITAYCSCAYCCNKSDGITASGTTATEGRTIAMYDVPLGTVLRFNGQDYIVEDRGTPYGHIDLFMSSHEQALQFGVQYTEVFMKTN